MAWLSDLSHTHWRKAFAAIVISPVSIIGLCVAGLPQAALVVICAAVIAVNVSFGRAIVNQISRRLDNAEAHHETAQVLLSKAHDDPVTGLLNRSGGEAHLFGLAEELQDGEALALMWIDLCRFRETNNTLGHARGDNLLHQVGQRLLDTAPQGALVARSSGDRFMLAAPALTQETAQELAAQVHDAMSAPLHIGGHRITNGAAIGVALMPGDARCTDQLQEAADLALFHARAGGGCGMRFHDASMIRPFDHQKQTEAELRDAVMKHELSLLFQPVVDLQTQRTRAFEAQVRWFHSSKGELALDHVMAGAEGLPWSGGPVITVGNWTIAEAAKIAKDWPDDVALTVKVLPAQINAPGAALGVLAALGEAGLDPARLELQIGGSCLRKGDQDLAAYIRHLEAKGVRFAVHDPDINSAANHLIALHPISSVRISSEPGAEAAMCAAARFGQSLGLEMVATAVGTAEQLQAARLANCTSGQGRHICGPLSAEMALNLVAGEDGKADDEEDTMRRKLAS